MSFFDRFKIWAKATEKDVLDVIVKVKQGFEVAERDFKKAWKWLFDHVDEITSAVNTISEVVTGLNAAGLKIPVSVSKSVAEANKAVATLNALMEASGEDPNAQKLIDGYIAAKNVWGAADKASVAVAMAPQKDVK